MSIDVKERKQQSRQYSQSPRKTARRTLWYTVYRVVPCSTLQYRAVWSSILSCSIVVHSGEVKVRPIDIIRSSLGHISKNNPSPSRTLLNMPARPDDISVFGLSFCFILTKTMTEFWPCHPVPMPHQPTCHPYRVAYDGMALVHDIIWNA